MPVNPSEQAFFEMVAAMPAGKPIDEMSLSEFRATGDFFAEYTGPMADVEYRDLMVPVRDGSEIRVRLLNPDAPSTQWLVFFPGCGYVLDMFDVNSVACSRIAAHLDCKVMLVDYRLAPEYPVPAQVYDGIDAIKALMARASELSIDPNALLVGGMSSGAHCAAVIASLSRYDADFAVKKAILVGGCYDLTFSCHDYDAYANEDQMCTPEALAYLFRCWNVAEEQLADPMISPALDPNLTGLPPITLIVGEYDRLRNDTELFYQRLQAAGAEVRKIVLPGQTHNTFVLRAALTDGDDPAEVIARECS